MKLLPRLSAMTILTAHGVAAAAWLWFMPGGFPIAHSRFWTNRIGPIVVLIIVIAAIVARIKQRTELFQLLALIVPFAWLGAAISGIVTFPTSARVLTPIGLIGAVTIAMSLRPFPKRSMAHIVTLTIACVAGAVLPPLERAGDPRTIPSNVPIASIPTDAMVQDYVRTVQLRGDVSVHPSSGQLNVSVGRLQIAVDPMLTFISRSPDRCWTIFAPREQRRGPMRRLTAMRRATDRPAVQLWYEYDDLAQLSVDASDSDWIEIDAQTRLPGNVFSHLNSFSEIAIIGHRKLELGFSPCPDTRIDVKYSDYPFGAPARFAYFDASSNRLRVVEATNAEKGPFHELASGPIARGEPLTITLFNEAMPIAAITLHDFTSQASDELSPTAGWRVPANSIVFALSDKSDRSPATIQISLADTGVGRGYDTVGHAAGVYRNRMTILVGE
jgi:hypothetical protein